MVSKLAEAISLAALAHDGQVDRNGEPYILHVLRVMLEQKDDKHRIVAVLHDLIEDTSWTIDALRHLGFSEEILAAVDVLTKREGESYFDRICAIDQNELATRVKLADLNDNMRPLKAPDDGAAARIEKYQRAKDMLLWR